MKERIYIYGAHSRAQTMGHYLTYLNPELEIVAYLYDNEEENPTQVNGVEVRKINNRSELDASCPAYLAIRGVNHSHAREVLLSCGISEIIPVDVQLDMQIRNEYLRKYFNSLGRDFKKITDFESNDNEPATDKSIAVYVASSYFDKALQEPYQYAEYERILQVGTDLADRKIEAYCFDNDGENISNRNKQFCEITGLYWIWKHAREDYVGLVHYRRHFILPDSWKQALQENHIDVILPVPLYVAPSLEENYNARHDSDAWDAMMKFICEKDKNEYNSIIRFFSKTGLYSPCNMFIMRREVLDGLCSWLFPVLFAVADQCGLKDDSYQNRYPGFLSERLITYYFEKHRDKYNVVYADKNFLP